MTILISPIKSVLKKIPIISNSLRTHSRKNRANSYFKQSRKQIKIWSRERTEFSNYYYNLTPTNEKYLTALLSYITHTSIPLVEKYFREVHENNYLKEVIFKSWENDVAMKDAQIAFGRRIGWYALIRIVKPKFVIETGVHQGIGACIIASALEENIREGFPGKYLGTDIDINAGKLFNLNFSHVGKIQYGDSIESLSTINEPIDFFINDSDHSAEYEYREYLIIKDKLAPNAIILGDNSHVTEALYNFSIENGRSFIFFEEEPLNHWYPGGGIGISIP